VKGLNRVQDVSRVVADALIHIISGTLWHIIFIKYRLERLVKHVDVQKNKEWAGLRRKVLMFRMSIKYRIWLAATVGVALADLCWYGC
jgi:hypothetical protein